MFTGQRQSLRVAKAIAEGNDTLATLREALGATKAQVYNGLHTLERHKFVEKIQTHSGAQAKYKLIERLDVVLEVLAVRRSEQAKLRQARAKAHSFDALLEAFPIAFVPPAGKPRRIDRGWRG